MAAPVPVFRVLNDENHQKRNNARAGIVVMLVLVLMTSCQVSEKPNSGPVTAHAGNYQ
jgi:hypothetical protein